MNFRDFRGKQGMKKLDNLTEEKLIDLYVTNKRSLEDIGKIYGVSRVAVYKKLKKYGIKQRSKSEARLEAQKQGKLPQEFFDINESFFSTWSPDMAYVLGLIITDGCVSRTGTVSLRINDRELLEKVKKVMRAEHNITASRHQKNLYIFHFARENMVRRLGALGIMPKKSLVVKFPEIPQEYLPDFIRGIFDGDGSVMLNKISKYCPLIAKFYSGSKEFIEGMESKLQELGMPKRIIYCQKARKNPYHSIVYGHKDCERLFRIMYGNTSEGLFLERKYNRFLEGFKRTAVGAL